MSVRVVIPPAEIIIEAVRSRGPGGQNVNKTATKVIARWHLGSSRALTGDEKLRVSKKLVNRITSSGELVVSADTYRSQLRNRSEAARRLNSLVGRALSIPKPRRPTKPTRASKLRQLKSKRHTAKTKQLRRLVEYQE